MAAEEEGKEPEQVEYESDHESRLWPDEAERSTTCRADGVLAKHRSSLGGGTSGVPSPAAAQSRALGLADTGCQAQIVAR